MLALAAKLKPAWKGLREEILSADMVSIDQSPWRVLGHEKSWQMWTLSTAKLAYFDIKKSKGFEDGKRVLGAFKVTLVGGDDTRFARGIAADHARALLGAPAPRRREAARVRPDSRTGDHRLIREFYDVEDEAADDIERRRFLRHTRSRDVLRRLHEWRLEQRPLPSSPTAKLLGYLDNQKDGLARFLEDPRIPIDNNQSERGYLWVAVGRRSFFGSRSELGTEVAAILYSLAESARRNGVDPKAYFAAALDDAIEGARSDSRTR